MNDGMLNILECPFCGGSFNVQPSPPPEVRGREIVTGILACACCAYPVVDGIPFIRAGRSAESAMQLLGGGRARDALLLLLGLADGTRTERFARLLDDAGRMTFREALEVLCPDAEGAYLLYRFSDPTFLCTQAVLRSTLEIRASPTGRILDVCGGTGHLARTLSRFAAGSAEMVVADISFWKLWLAKRFVAPECEPVACDAATPLPFGRGAFSLTCCCDAFHYIWPRRLLAAEMMRATDAGGTLVLCHLHNALCDNPSPGMPLTPAGYRHLFRERQPALFKQSDVLDALVERPAELTACSDADLAHEAALVLIAGTGARDAVTMRPVEVPRAAHWSLNPLYVRANGTGAYELRFPSDFYAEEFADCRRYLPDRVELPGAAEGVMELAARHVLLELPDRYL